MQMEQTKPFCMAWHQLAPHVNHASPPWHGALRAILGPRSQVTILRVLMIVTECVCARPYAMTASSLRVWATIPLAAELITILRLPRAWVQTLQWMADVHRCGIPDAVPRTVL